MSANQARSWEQTYAPQPQQQEKQKAVKVKKQSWITKGEKVLYSLFGFCIIIASVYMVSFASSTEQLNKEVQSLENTVDHQQVINEGLTYEKAKLSEPERIIRIAHKHGLTIQASEVKQATAYNN
ncbi:cell division protein FtsL [Virgibacillus siamensis]|uniref:cell division protein FtsL n=1 Tax=Virgibacillus siamensis TaxID=480071 RepID=UPI0009876DDD|nr:cell division protein FtsL [Virgibacillus siamensis]